MLSSIFTPISPAIPATIIWHTPFCAQCSPSRSIMSKTEPTASPDSLRILAADLSLRCPGFAI